MAKTYQQRNQENIAKTGKSLYQIRIEKAQAKGLSRAQARGHARTHYGEQPASAINKATRGTRGTHKPPKITQRVQKLNNGTKIVQTRSSQQVGRYLKSNAKTGGKRLNRVYFQVFDPSSGNYVNVYYGKPGKKGFHGITVEELNRRIQQRLDSGEYDNYDDALWDVISDDVDNDYIESSGYEGGAIPSSMSQVTMYIRPS